MFASAQMDADALMDSSNQRPLSFCTFCVRVLLVQAQQLLDHMLPLSTTAVATAALELPKTCSYSFCVQVNDINEASLQQFAAKIEAATAGAGNKLAMSTAVKDADYEQLAAMVNAISGCPHHVSTCISHHVDTYK